MEATSPLVQIERSPYIPRSIDNTALKDFLACPRRYFYAYVLNRRGRGTGNSPALVFGGALHKGLEVWYKTGDKMAAVKAIFMDWKGHARPDDHRTVERCVSVLESYIQHYGDLATENRAWGKTVGWPENPLVEIPVELSWPGSRHPYTGRIDRIVEQAGLYYVEDHKTTSQLGPYYFQQFDPDNQMMGYAVLAQEITGLPIAGVRINAIGVLKTQTKFARELISFSAPRLEEWRRMYNQHILDLETRYARYQRLLDEGLSPLQAADEAWELRHNACSGKYGQCTYASVDTNNPAIRQRILESEFEENAWNPMAAFEGGEVDA